jgi:hypothetical protein
MEIFFTSVYKSFSWDFKLNPRLIYSNKIGNSEHELFHHPSNILMITVINTDLLEAATRFLASNKFTPVMTKF